MLSPTAPALTLAPEVTAKANELIAILGELGTAQEQEAASAIASLTTRASEASSEFEELLRYTDR